jgi:predicted acetyltransferase
MPDLTLPDVHVRESFVDAMEEFRREGRGVEHDGTVTGSMIRDFSPGWETPAGFDAFIGWLSSLALEETPRASDSVPATELWWVDGNVFLGRLQIRHRLNSLLLEVGGHIGYDVRPSARRNGHATAMLRAALPVAKAIGIDPALITCNPTNVASRKVIEHNGGVLEDERLGKLRYWVPTTP